MRSTSVERIAAGAYHRWLSGEVGTALDHWLRAEMVERAAAEKRKATGRKAAAARWSKTPTVVE